MPISITQGAGSCSGGCHVIRGEDGGYNLVPQSSREDGEAAGIAWVLICGFIVVFMQLGFAMLEVGSCREKHSMTVLMKNTMDAIVSAPMFAVYVYVLHGALSDAPCGLVADAAGRPLHHLVLWNWAFAATSVTICSGSVAERTQITAYLTFAVVASGFIYPVLATSAWSDTGLFSGVFHRGAHPFHDFAGSGVVHVTGAACALAGHALLGPRVWKSMGPDGQAQGPLRRRLWLEVGDGEDRGELAEREEAEFESFSGYLQTMGTLILWVAWYCFNAGSTLELTEAAATSAGIIAWNTTLAAAGAGLAAFSAKYFHIFDTALALVGLAGGEDTARPVVPIGQAGRRGWPLHQQHGDEVLPPPLQID